MDTKVWELSESDWYIRFFLWIWNASPQRLNVCKLFWGTIFLPLSLFVGIPAAAKRHTVLTFSDLAVFYLMIGFVLICLGWYLSADTLFLSAGILFFFALFLFLVLENFARHTKDKAQRIIIKQKSLINQDRALNRLTKIMTADRTLFFLKINVFWKFWCKFWLIRVLQSGALFIGSIIDKTLHYLLFIPVSWMGRVVIGKPALLMIEYAKEVKHKFCPVIILVSRKRA